jgi:hypothetical protein
MDVALASLLNLYDFSTGRRLFALQQVAKAALLADFKELAAHAHSAVKHDQSTRALETTWAATPAKPKGQAEVQKLDVLVDRALVSIRDTAQAQADGAEDDDEDDDEIAKKVETLLTAIFPKGVQAVTQLTFVDELAAVDGILAALKGKKLAPIVADLGLTRQVKRLTKLNAKYRTAQETPAASATSFGDVRGARAQGQEHLLQAVAMILGKYPQSTPEHIAARTSLLGPILKQNDAIRLYLRSRRAVQDVNPETGEIDPDAPAGEPAAETSPK